MCFELLVPEQTTQVQFVLVVSFSTWKVEVEVPLPDGLQQSHIHLSFFQFGCCSFPLVPLVFLQFLAGYIVVEVTAEFVFIKVSIFHIII